MQPQNSPNHNILNKHNLNHHQNNIYIDIIQIQISNLDNMYIFQIVTLKWHLMETTWETRSWLQDDFKDKSHATR
jgi:hypothetical protein